MLLGGRRANAQRPAESLHPTPAQTPYAGPNVIIVRFGGGVRRRETIDPRQTQSPFLCHALLERGTLFSQMEITDREGIQTSHGEGTLNILTGRYDVYKDVEARPLGARFVAQAPTLFEYLRKTCEMPEHHTVIVNGEDRIDEEFYTFSSHHLYGVSYRSTVLSLYRFKTYVLRQQLASGRLSQDERTRSRKQLQKAESLDYRIQNPSGPSPELNRFWENWRHYYGDSGLVNPRGDRVLTELAVRAMRELKPKLMMINYQDCDYVHWGNASHYTRGIQIMDQGVRQLVDAVEADSHYRGRTVFAVLPDCGRDDNRAMAIPFQHHFGSASSRKIFALLLGPGVPRGVVVDRTVQQIDVAPTLGRLMNVATPYVEGTPLEEAFA